MTPHKLYIVLAAGLSSGLKMAQAVHAAILFGEQFPHLKNYWYKESNNVAVLQVEDLPELADLLHARSETRRPIADQGANPDQHK